MWSVHLSDVSMNTWNKKPCKSSLLINLHTKYSSSTRRRYHGHHQRRPQQKKITVIFETATRRKKPESKVVFTRNINRMAALSLGLLLVLTVLSVVQDVWFVSAGSPLRPLKRLFGKKEYTPLVFFKTPPGMSPDIDEMVRYCLLKDKTLPTLVKVCMRSRRDEWTRLFDLEIQPHAIAILRSLFCYFADRDVVWFVFFFGLE